MNPLRKNLLAGLTVIAVFTLSCQRTNFESKGEKHPAGEKDPEEPAADAEVPPDQDVDDPEQIAGVFLVCAPAVDADAPAADADWLCRIDRDGALADLTLGAVTWTLANPSGETVAALPASAGATAAATDPSITLLIDAAPWHVAVRYPKAPAGALVRADVNWSDGRSSHLKTVLNRDSEPVWHLGAVRDIHLGDGAFPDGGCKGPIAVTPLTGAILSIPLTVTSPTTISVEITDVCGIDYDEVLFYHAGDFFSRTGIKPGMMTFHPQGIHHGPQPGAVERAKAATKTDEVAVMIDTRHPLLPGPGVKSSEIDNYWRSWSKP